MKKLLIALMMCVGMFLSITGCGKEDAKPNDNVPVENESTEKKDDYKYTEMDLATLVSNGDDTKQNLESIADEYGYKDLQDMIDKLVEKGLLYKIPAFTYTWIDENGEEKSEEYEETYTIRGTIIYNNAAEMGVIKELYDEETLAVLVSNHDYPDEKMNKIAIDNGYENLQDMIDKLVEKKLLYYIPDFIYIGKDKDGNETSYVYQATYSTNRTVIYHDAVEMGVIKE